MCSTLQVFLVRMATKHGKRDLLCTDFNSLAEASPAGNSLQPAFEEAADAFTHFTMLVFHSDQYEPVDSRPVGVEIRLYPADRGPDAGGRLSRATDGAELRRAFAGHFCVWGCWV